MSWTLHWERPPVDVDRRAAVDHDTDTLLVDLLFDGDTSTNGYAVIEAGSYSHSFLRGAYAAAELVADGQTSGMAEDLELLLGLIAEHGAAVVRVTR